MFLSSLFKSASQDLINAASQGNLDEVKRLVDGGADVDYKDSVSLLFKTQSYHGI